MRSIYSIAIAVIVMALIVVPAYAARDPLGALPNEIGGYLNGIVQFFENIVSSMVQAINSRL